jgi:hypothetical protein
MMIDDLKENHKTTAISYNALYSIVIGVFDNNADRNKETISWKDYRSRAEKNGVEVRRIREEEKEDRQYDWWITLFPVANPIAAIDVMRRLSSRLTATTD